MTSHSEMRPMESEEEHSNYIIGDVILCINAILDLVDEIVDTHLATVGVEK